MEPKNHRIKKENHLPNLHFGVPSVNFQGCIHFYAFKFFMPCLRIVLDMQDEPEVFFKLRTPVQDVTDVTGWAAES